MLLYHIPPGGNKGRRGISPRGSALSPGGAHQLPGLGGLCLPYGVMAVTVSYTHLDVYKRQAYDRVGFVLPAMDKEQFFPILRRVGVLPRKTFSMGEANEKRYYMECRKIR